LGASWSKSRHRAKAQRAPEVAFHLNANPLEIWFGILQLRFRTFNAMPGPARLITLNLGSQTIALAEFRAAHGGLALVDYRLRETPLDPETGQRRDAHVALHETAAVLREMMREMQIHGTK
jgi:hypothetical protein